VLTRGRGGFTLPELVVALVLLGIVCTVIYRLLVGTQRLYQWQTQRIELDDNLRSAMAILPTELRELDASDPVGSDIIEMTDSSLAYKAMRSLRWVCADVQAGSQLYLDTAWIGLRAVDARYDSVLIFADSQAAPSTDGHWYHADVTAPPTAGRDCNGAPSVRLDYRLSSAYGRARLVAGDGVVGGNPVRAFEVVRVMRYRDASGVTWVGLQRRGKHSGWSAPQPLLGPLDRRGLRFTYYGADGAVTTSPALVASIGIAVVGRTSQRVYATTGSLHYVVDSLVTRVALRNNR
jgi:prepilin-type N-terminal cleavage/methylation domain-containing protein